MSGDALAMRLKFRTLMQKHRVQNQPCKIPLSDPVGTDLMAEGYASTNDLDLDRVRFRRTFWDTHLVFERLPTAPCQTRSEPNSRSDLNSPMICRESSDSGDSY